MIIVDRIFFIHNKRLIEAWVLDSSRNLCGSFYSKIIGTNKYQGGKNIMDVVKFISCMMAVITLSEECGVALKSGITPCRVYISSRYCYRSTIIAVGVERVLTTKGWEFRAA
jgi:hypothetical protein